MVKSKELKYDMKYSFKEFQRQAVIRFLALDKYKYIKENLYKCDVSKDPVFQKKFNSFYRVRRDEKWRKKFYNYFEKNKNNTNIGFETILKDLLLETGNIEASFSSKMLSLINNDMPIWDQYVLKNAGVAQPSQGSDRFDSTVSVYSQLCEWYECYLKTENSKECIRHFDKTFPKYKEISDIKKIDFYLWMIRE